MLYKSIILIALLVASVLANFEEEAYCPVTFKRKRTVNNTYDLQVFCQKDKMCWYAKGFNNDYSKPGCCFQNGRTEMYDMMGLNGDKWNYCITIKKGTTIDNVDLYVDNSNIQCKRQSQTFGKTVRNVRAYCNENGCLTKYGLVTKYTDKREC